MFQQLTFISSSETTVAAGVDISGTLISFVIIAILLFLSALASGSEAAFFTLGPNEKDKLKNEQSRTSDLIIKLLNTPKELLATILITNNFVNVGIVIISSSLLEDLYPREGANETVRFIVEVIGITLLILLIGEVIPKIYASRYPLTFAKFTAYPLNIVRTTPPFSWLKSLLVNGTSIINRIAGKKGVKITSDELEMAIELTKEENTSEEEHRILEGIVNFGNKDARQIMRSRLEMTAIERESRYAEVLKTILEAGYSRMPVYLEHTDNVIGILYIKDLLPHLDEADDFDWRSLMRKPFFIPENKKIDDLLREFQHLKMHMAVVVDEYGGASGIVTLEDVLEEIVGDITDEFDDEEIIYSRVDKRTFIFEGRTALVDFYKVTEVDDKDFEASKGDSETLGGFIIEHAGRILRNNEFIECSGVKLIVEASDKRRIKMIKVILPEE
jgi:gliding motility-associated protein GldE